MDRLLKCASYLALTVCAQFTFAEGGLLGIACESPPPMHCASGECGSKLAMRGNITDEQTGRQYFLDYPCDLKDDESVVFILNLHGGGSIGNWQRHYFPAMDYKEKYRLVVATPTGEGGVTRGDVNIRMWSPSKDDEHLQNIVNQVVAALGEERIKSFWLAGHSQGGMTSFRVVCNDFFADKVDGFLSLSGGRIGRADFVPRFGPPDADGNPPPAREPRSLSDTQLPACDFSHIFAIGEHEIAELPETSPWAEKYSCDAREKSEIVDTKAGWVEDSGRKGYKVWGMAARPGTADVFNYPNCKDGKVVADVVRIDKGHTEGLEPSVTEKIIELMVSATGGKISGK
ncbi:hypothetical protein NBRC116494_13930 [Aurantivibrio plasticivorans]